MTKEEACDIVIEAIEAAANVEIGFISTKSSVGDFDRFVNDPRGFESIAPELSTRLGIPIADADLIPDVVDRLLEKTNA
jgi:hypothetical protein